MSSQSSTFLLGFSPTFTAFPSPSPAKNISKLFTNVWSFGRKDERVNSRFDVQCKAVSEPRPDEYADVFQNGFSVTKWNEIVEDDIEGEALEVSTPTIIKQHVAIIQSILGSMEDGEISVSAYDTAWVGLVEDVHGSGTPQFPSSLRWIANNQLSDGSWGDSYIFSAHDRIINTLACVIALKSWNIHSDKSEKGLSFVKENICKLGDENAEHMPVGFEVAFPSLIEMSKKLGIEIPDDSHFLQEIYAKRNLKLTRYSKRRGEALTHGEFGDLMLNVHVYVNVGL